jgi:hypothetical protein
MSVDNRFEQFVSFIKKEGIDLDDETTKIIQEAINKIYLETPVTKGKAKKTKAVKTTQGKKTSYQNFVTSETARLKKEDPTMTGITRKTQISAAWKALSPQEKKDYVSDVSDNDSDSDSPAPVDVEVKSSKPKKLSGYNLYMREKMNSLKETSGSGTNSKEKLKEVGVSWKNSSDDEKKEWNQKAKAIEN